MKFSLYVAFLSGEAFLTLASWRKKRNKKEVSLTIKPFGLWKGLWLLKGRDRTLQPKTSKQKKIEKMYCTEKFLRLDSLLWFQEQLPVIVFEWWWIREGQKWVKPKKWNNYQEKKFCAALALNQMG